MADRDPLAWPAPCAATEGEDSIAGQLASRIEAVPPAPDDAIDWAAVAAVFEAEATALSPRPAAAQLLFEAGRIHEDQLGNGEAALDYFRRAVGLDRGFVPALRACRRLAMERGQDALAAEILDAEASIAPTPEARAELLLLRGRLLAALGRDAEAAAVLERAVAAAPGSFAAAEEAARAAAERNDREALAEAYVRCARAAADRRLSAHYLAAASALLEEGLGRPDRAGVLALDAFALLPEDPLLRSGARHHAERLGRTDALAEILRADAEAAHGPGAATAWLALAHLEERLGRSDAAVAALERGRAAAPGDPLVLSEIARLREARGAWADACDALEALALAHLAREGAGHVEEAVVARLRRAEIEEGQLGRTHQAIACCREVLELDPANRAALAALGRLCARSADWEGLLAAFEAEARAAREPRERAHRTFRAGEVLEERLGRIGDAIAAYRTALELDPDLVAARAALERLHEREGRWEELCALLEGELGALRSPAERIAQLFRMARLREERLSDLEGARALYVRILELDPGNGVALPALGAVLGRLGRHEELAQVLQREAELAQDPRRAIAFLQRRAELVEEHLDDPERARAAWEDVRAAAPTHLPALRALGRLHARAARWEELAAMCRAEADASADPAAAAELLHRVAELLERRMGRVDDAVSAYRETLTLAPAHLPALQALARIYRARGDDEALVEVLRAQGAARAVPVERAAPLAEAARIAEERLGDPARAIEHYEEALRLAPDFKPARRALDRLYAQTGRFDALAALRRDVVDGTPEERAERLLRLARLEADRTGDRAAALRALDEFLAVAPDHPAGLLLELRLSSDPDRRAHARAALAAASGEPEPSAALLVGAAMELRSASARHEALSRAAALDPASAVLAPEEERRLRDAGDAVRLAAYYQRSREWAGDAPSRACWAAREGEAWERAGDPERALAAFQAALAEAPASLPALRGARALFARQGDWAAVRATLQAEGAALRDAHAAAAAWVEAGDIAQHRFHDPEAALPDYHAAAERAPQEPEPLARLEAILGPQRASELARVHEARAAGEQDARRAAESWLAAARAAAESPEGLETALESLDRALNARPDHAPALALRARLRARAGRHEEALLDCEACVAIEGEPAARVALHLEAAAICQDRLHAPGRALPHLAAALVEVPESAEALARLARGNEALGRTADAADALRRLVAIPGLPDEALAGHLVALAEAAERLGDRIGAATACRRALAVEPAREAALQLLLRLEGASDDPWVQVAALETAAASSRDPQVRAVAHGKAARLHAGALRSRAKAVEHLRSALTFDPARDEDRALLAELLEEIAPLAALEEHRALLARDPLRLASWTALYRHFDRTHAHDRAYVAATVIRWLGGPPLGPTAERLLLEGDRQVLPAPPSFGAEAWNLLRAPGDRGPLADVVALGGDAIAAATGKGPQEHPEPVRGDHPFRRLLVELGRAFELPPHELYAASPGTVEVEPGQPYLVRVGVDVPRRTTVREQRFLLGRVAATLRSRSCLGRSLPARTLVAWAGAAARVGVGGATDDEMTRQLARALPRRARKALEPAARALLGAVPPPDPATWIEGAARTADRLGLLLCGDVPTAIEVLLREVPDRPADPALALAAAAARADIRALLAFAASDVHFALRQRLRVAIA